MNDNAETSAESTAASSEPATPKTTNRPTENAAVAKCNLARQRAYNKEYADSGNEVAADLKGEEAFRRAMPPLAGYENICDFIACLTYGLLTDAFRLKRTDCLFEAAKIALATLRHEPKPGPHGVR